MMKPRIDPNPADDQWDASWAATERAQLETTLAATPEQRLAWLEQAMRLAYGSAARPGTQSTRS